jgi:hypothetical protein
VPELPQPEHLTVHEARRYLRVKTHTLARLMRHAHVPVALRKGKHLVTRSDLQRLRRKDRP